MSGDRKRLYSGSATNIPFHPLLPLRPPLPLHPPLPIHPPLPLAPWGRGGNYAFERVGELTSTENSSNEPRHFVLTLFFRESVFLVLFCTPHALQNPDRHLSRRHPLQFHARTDKLKRPENIYGKLMCWQGMPERKKTRLELCEEARTSFSLSLSQM